MLEALIVADDLTGAAEMAGIGVDYGLPGEVVTEAADLSARGGGLVALDSDTRQVAREAAVERLTKMLQNPPVHRLFYKKTDSVLRGHIMAELAALLAALGKRRAILLAQNPSKGRAITRGQYVIDGVPLEQTDFRLDPEYPRETSRVEALLGGNVHVMSPGEALPAEGIIVAEGASAEDVDWWAEQGDGATLWAGGADLFQALLRHQKREHRPVRVELPASEMLMVCGSACDYSRRCVTGWQKRDVAVCPLPDILFQNPYRGASAWQSAIVAAMRSHGIAILAVPQPAEAFRAAGIRTLTADTVHRVLLTRAAGLPLQLFVEGGATGAAIVQALQWTAFAVKGNLAPGVVAMQPIADPHVTVIIKPGSYRWPERIESLTHASTIRTA